MLTSVRRRGVSQCLQETAAPPSPPAASTWWSFVTAASRQPAGAEHPVGDQPRLRTASPVCSDGYWLDMAAARRCASSWCASSVGFSGAPAAWSIEGSHVLPGDAKARGPARSPGLSSMAEWPAATASTPSSLHLTQSATTGRLASPITSHMGGWALMVQVSSAACSLPPPPPPLEVDSAQVALQLSPRV